MNSKIMCLSDKLYVKVNVTKNIRSIILEDNKNITIEQLKAFEKAHIDDIVCTLMYYNAKKGPIMIEKILNTIEDIATARLIEVLLRQSEVTPLLLDNYIVFELSAINVVKCYNVLQDYLINIGSYALDCLDQDKIPSFNLDDMLIILHQTLCETLSKINHMAEARKFIASSANMTELLKVEEYVENAVKLISSKITYTDIALSIERTPLYETITSNQKKS